MGLRSNLNLSEPIVIHWLDADRVPNVGVSVVSPNARRTAIA